MGQTKTGQAQCAAMDVFSPDESLTGYLLSQFRFRHENVRDWEFRMRSHPHIWLTTILLVLCSSSLLLSDVTRTLEPSDVRVRQLIQRLGSKQYAIRKSAEDELQRLGRAALDQLLVAQFNEDAEVRHAVLDLLSRMTIRWMPEDAPDIVRDITDKYGKSSQREKIIYSYWLVRLEDGLGLPALARIVRYEPSETIAKQAAMALIDEMDALDPVQVDAFLRVFDDVLSQSPRVPAIWLRRLAADLIAGNSSKRDDMTPSWKMLATDEAKLQGTKRSEPYLVGMLHQKWAESARDHGPSSEIRPAVEQLIELRKDSAGLIVETSLWLIRAQQFELFDELIWDRFKDIRATNPLFAYCNYFSKLEQGKTDEAQQAADFAYEMTDRDELYSDNFDRAYARLQLARKLEIEGFADAAIREYQRLLEMDSSYQVSRVQYETVGYFSELLHDRQRELEAAKVLEKIVKPGEGSLIEGFEKDSSNTSRMYFFYSEHHRLRGEREKQIEYLNLAIKASPTDADVLIAMHRLPRADKKWKERTSKLIAEAVKSFENRLKPLKAAGEFENRADAATYLNQVAWLVSNTEGDFQKAIQQSRRSLELRPASGGSLDTLGRAYFAAGDMSNALRYQRRAVRMLPGSQQIVRQLEEFESKQ